jgi:hypothetical protein
LCYIKGRKIAIGNSRKAISQTLKTTAWQQASTIRAGGAQKCDIENDELRRRNFG